MFNKNSAGMDYGAPSFEVALALAHTSIFGFMG